MKRLFTNGLLALLVVPALLLSFTTITPYKANFTGSWNLNESKSELGEFGSRFSARKIKVEQKDDAIIITRTSKNMEDQDVTSAETLTFDGKTSETSGFFNSKKKSVLKWAEDGNSFVISYTVVFERDGETTEIKGTETYTLSTDGKTMTSSTASSSPQGDFSMKAAYDKE